MGQVKYRFAQVSEAILKVHNRRCSNETQALDALREVGGITDAEWKSRRVPKQATA
jgi:hypothetical protein